MYIIIFTMIWYLLTFPNKNTEIAWKVICPKVAYLVDLAFSLGFVKNVPGQNTTYIRSHTTIWTYVIHSHEICSTAIKITDFKQTTFFPINEIILVVIQTLKLKK